MLKSKKLLPMLLIFTMIFSLCSVTSFASTHEISEDIQFVELDDIGNVVGVSELVYLEDVAEAYEASKRLRWPATTYYNLANGPYSISNIGSSMLCCTRHFNANSSGRLYYEGEVTGAPATLDIYDITNSTYKGSFYLTDLGDGSYKKNGYISGLNTSSSQYYSFGVTAYTAKEFSSCYAVISWNSI